MKGHGPKRRARGTRQRKNTDGETQPKTFPSGPKRRKLFLSFSLSFSFSLHLKQTMSSGVENSGVPAKTPTPSPREEPRDPDTPLRSESGEASANKAEENRTVNKTVIISQEEYASPLRLKLSSSMNDERNNEITPNVSPLESESKAHDMQEKPAALGGKKPASRTERLEIKMMMTRLQEMLDQTSDRKTPLFPEPHRTPRSSRRPI